MTDPVKRFVKVLLGRSLLSLGLWNRMLQAWAQHHAALILNYHRVIEKWDRALDYSQPGMVVTAATFDRQLCFLKDHFDIVSLGSLFAEATIDRPARRPRCAITFDDGWRDNYDVAFPILRKYDIPATVFVATDFIGTERAFWHTELSYLLLEAAPELLRGELVSRAWPEPVRVYLSRLARSQREFSAVEIDPAIEMIKAMLDEETIEELIQALGRAVGFSKPFFQNRLFFLDWAQIAEMAASGIDIGSHSCSHRMLTRLPAEEAMAELVQSKAAIESRIGREVEHFAFPNEAASAALLRLATSAGYRAACVDDLGDADGTYGIRSLRRLGMHEAVCNDGRGFNEALLCSWLLRAPKVRPV